MENNYSLAVFGKDADFAARLQETVKEIKKSNTNLRTAASQYTNKYQEEVNVGTRKLQLLLEEGKRRGYSEEEILENQKNFYPTVRTPILNMLFFLLREHPDAADIDLTRLVSDVGRNHNELLAEQNSKYGSLQHDLADEHTADEAPEMETFIYGAMTHDTYKKIKKLKALSQSGNKAEAFAAYTKCLELCKKYNLEFDKVKI